MSDLQELTFKQGEGKWIKFIVTKNGTAVDLSAATLKFAIKQSKRDTTYLYSQATVDFDVSEAASGIVRASLPASQTSLMDVGKYDAECKFTVTADTDVDKTQDFVVKITPAVITD